MPKVNTTSVRAEITQAKQQFDALDGAGQLSADVRALLLLLLMVVVVVDLLVAVFLEKSTAKNSKNSSIPASQSEEDNSAKPSGSNKKGPKQNDEQFDNGRTVEDTTTPPVTQCGSSGARSPKRQCSSMSFSSMPRWRPGRARPHQAVAGLASDERG